MRANLKIFRQGWERGCKEITRKIISNRRWTFLKLLDHPSFHQEKPDRFQDKPKFDSILEVAREIKTVNPSALYDFIRLVARKVQSEFMSKAIYRGLNGEDLSCADRDTLWWNEDVPISWQRKTEECPYSTLDDFKKEVKPKGPLCLKHDLILPWPWKTERIVNNLCEIGHSRTQGQWREDWNHYVEMWLPWRITWVYGGNHSIMVGIIQGEGRIENYGVYDLSEVFDYIYTDGINFYRKEDDSIIGPALNLEFAAIFEIGRLMVNSG